MSGRWQQTPWQGKSEQAHAAGATSSRMTSATRSRASSRSHRSNLTGQSHAEKARPSAPVHRPVRNLLETLVLLALAVTVFRTFVVEGFMITTGSMAPALYGYHYRVQCPDCGMEFAVNADVRNASELPAVAAAQTMPQHSPFDDPGGDPFGSGTAGSETSSQSGELTAAPLAATGSRCPNCQYAHIQLKDRVINEGDQLLVDKQAFVWKKPERWNSVVFRNPTRSTQAYAKRIIGLPGEVLKLEGGDVYVGGNIQRKTLADQRQIRILVSDSRYQPQLHDANWRGPWQPNDDIAAACWERSGEGWRCTPPSDVNPDTSTRLNFAHWVREGGSSKFTVPLQRWPGDIPLPTPDANVQYDAASKQISCLGALPADVLEKLISVSSDPQFQQAIERLFVRSHRQPVSDHLAYNPNSRLPRRHVRDLMLELDVKPDAVQSQLRVGLNEGRFQFVCDFDFAAETAELRIDGKPTTLRSGSLPERQFEEPVKIEVSLFDRQVLVAVDGQVLFEPYAYREAETPSAPPAVPFFVAARGTPLTILRQRVYRDVYYRALTHYEADQQPPEYRLGPDEYFVLGDNSAVSFDSRHWPAGSISGSLLIGRPFILHLPSRKAQIALGPYELKFRSPEWHRVRLLR